MFLVFLVGDFRTLEWDCIASFVRIASLGKNYGGDMGKIEEESRDVRKGTRELLSINL